MTTTSKAATKRVSHEQRRKLLSDAVFNDDVPTIRSILEADPGLGTTALMTAVAKHELATVEILLRAGVAPDTPNENRFTPLCMAVEQNDVALMKVLLAAGADPNSWPTNAPIWAAVLRGNGRAVEVLLEAGAKLDPVSKSGATLIHKAAEFGHDAIAARLLKAGMPVDVLDESGNTPLHYAARSGNTVCVLLMQRGADVNARAEDGRTPALVAARHGLIDLFELLVASGADALARDEKGRNAFELAIEEQKDRMALSLIRRFPALAPSGEALDAAFVLAVRNGCTEAVKLLAGLGADIGQKPDGRSLLQCAPSRGADELKRVLRSLKSEAVIASAMGTSSTEPSSTPRRDSPIL